MINIGNHWLFTEDLGLGSVLTEAETVREAFTVGIEAVNEFETVKKLFKLC